MKVHGKGTGDEYVLYKKCIIYVQNDVCDNIEGIGFSSAFSREDLGYNSQALQTGGQG